MNVASYYEKKIVKSWYWRLLSILESNQGKAKPSICLSGLLYQSAEAGNDIVYSKTAPSAWFSGLWKSCWKPAFSSVLYSLCTNSLKHRNDKEIMLFVFVVDFTSSISLVIFCYLYGLFLRSIHRMNLFIFDDI